MYMHLFKELAHMIMETGKSKIFRVGGKTKIQEEPMCKDEVGPLSYTSLWLHKLTHMREGNMLYSKSIDWNINLIQNQYQRNIQNNVWLHAWTPKPSQADTKKISHHTIQNLNN